MRNSAGVCRVGNGDRYVGEFQSGVPHGRGAMAYANGDRYEGSWQAGKRHGKGACSYANGEKYTGAHSQVTALVIQYLLEMLLKRLDTFHCVIPSF